MKHVLVLIVNLLVNFAASDHVNTKEAPPDSKEEYEDVMLLFDKNEVMTEMFEKSLSSSESGTNEIGMFGGILESTGESNGDDYGSGEMFTSASGEGIIEHKKVKSIRHMDTGCSCQGTSCQCCLEVGIGDIAGNACINITLLTEELGIKVSFLWKGETLFSNTVSVVNPPSICFPHPLFRLVKVCVRLSNVSLDNNDFGGCISLVLRLLAVSKEFHLGCYYAPDAEALIPTRDENRRPNRLRNTKRNDRKHSSRGIRKVRRKGSKRIVIGKRNYRKIRGK